jgi:4-hydroxy-tetrahydrodipicolinate synthase
MKPLRAEEIRGTWATVLLPLNADESIDFTRLAAQIDCLIASGVNGLYTNGTASEFYAQTEDEFDRLQALVAEKCERAGLPFQIGVNYPSAQTSLARLRRAARFKPGALQLILPDWLPVADAEAIAFLQRMAEAAAPVDLVLYNPPHAKRVLEPRDYARLKLAVPQLIGVKVMDGDANWYAEMNEFTRGLSVFVPGHHLATGLRQGTAAGSYSNVACLHPVGARRWYELMKTEPDRALEIEGRLRRFFAERITPFKKQGYSNAALDKLLAAIGAWSPVGTRLRWPYQWIPLDEAERLRPIAQTMIPELLPGSD